jgi:hypothetical protein
MDNYFKELIFLEALQNFTILSVPKGQRFI